MDRVALGGPPRRLMCFAFAILAAAMAVYRNGLAEHRWYPLAPDMGRWLAISIAPFVFFGVLKILARQRTSTD